MELPVSPAPGPLPLATHERALGIIATATVLALLYFARDVLVPITLAVFLSLLIVPLVRALRRYERTIKSKIKTLNEITVGRLDAFTVQAGRLVNRHAENERPTGLDAGTVPGPVAASQQAPSPWINCARCAAPWSP